jgi:hypothetical protein
MLDEWLPKVSSVTCITDRHCAQMTTVVIQLNLHLKTNLGNIFITQHI